MEQVKAWGEVAAVKTLTNGLTRITIDLQEDQIEETAVFLAFWKHSPYGVVTFTVGDEAGSDDEVNG